MVELAAESDIADRKCMLFRGTALTRGAGTGIVAFLIARIFDIDSLNRFEKNKSVYFYKRSLSFFWQSSQNKTAFRGKEIRLVSLSTTLATNAVTEGYGSKVCLMLR